MKTEIKNRFNGEVILCGEYENTRDCLEKNCEAELCEAELCEADLSEADLRMANLRMADLRMADLREADLSEADLDYSCWPLYCGSLQVKTSRKLRVQLMFHTLSLMNCCDDLGGDEKEIYAFCLKYANEFHREDVEKLEPKNEED